MAFMIYKPARTQEIDGRLRTLSKHEQWFVEGNKDFHTKWGIIKKTSLTPGTLTLKNETFYIVEAQFIDAYKAMRRKAQIITRKDIGFLIGYCGLHAQTIAVESGAGSGGASAMLAKLCKRLYSYEIDKENIDVVEENLARLGLKAAIANADFYDPAQVKAHKATFVLLDLPEPWRAIESALKTSIPGAYIVAYTPSIIQAQRFVAALPTSLLHERTLELIDRDWKVQGDAVRPVSGDIGHTAFLTIVRRIA